MKYFIVFIFIIASAAYSQEKNPDSISYKENLNTQQNFVNDLDLYFSLNIIQNNIKDIPISNNPKSIGLWTSFTVSQSYMEETIPGKTKSIMLSPLNIKFMENSKFNSIRYILGMAQTAAVGYMAYKHLKKYGFLK